MSPLAKAQTGFWNLAVTPSGGMVGADGKLLVRFTGSVRATLSPDAVSAVQLLNGSAILNQQVFWVGEDRFGNPVNHPREFSISVALPAGTHQLQLFAATVNDGIYSQLFEIVVQPPPYNGATFVSQDVPATMVAGQTYQVAITLANSGTTTWSPGGSNPHRLGGPPPYDTTWSFARAELPHTVPPGGQVTFNIPVIAPHSGGTVGFQVRMLQEGIDWFGAITPSATVQVSTPQPTVGFTTPAEGAAFTATGGTATVSFSGNAMPGIGASVGSLQLLESGVVFADSAGTSISGSKVLAMGEHSIELRITDSRGQIASAYRTVQVVAPPTAHFSGPVNGTNIVATGATTALAVSAAASASPGSSVSTIRLYVDGALATSSPGAALNTSLALAIGEYTLGVDAVDNNGVAGPRSYVTVRVVSPDASDPTGFWNLAVAPSGGTVGDDGTLTVWFNGSVRAVESLDAVTAVRLMKAGVVLSEQTYFVGSDRFDNPVNATRAIALKALLPAGTHTLHLQAATVNGGFDSRVFEVVVQAPPFNGATFIGQSVPSEMVAGQTYPVTVTMANTGTKTWTMGSSTPYRLGAPAPYDTTWAFGRSELPASVAPGGQVTFNFNVVAPQTGGAVDLQLNMVQDGVEWFGTPTQKVTVNVSVPQPAAVFASPDEGASYTALDGTAVVTFSGTVNPGSGASIVNVQLLETGIEFAASSTASIGGSKALSIGDHTIELRVTDSRGQVARLYRNVRIVAQSVAAFDSPPSGTTIIATGSTTAVMVSANAVPAAGASISQIRFFTNGVLSGTAAGTTASTSLALPVGEHIIGVDAVDSNGVAGPRSFVTLQVVPPAAPSASFNSPSNGSSVVTTDSSSTFAVSATATASLGAAIEQMKLYVNGELKHTVSAASLDVSVPLGLGTHTLAVEATDTFGSVGPRTSISVTVVGPPPPATATFTNPMDGASFTLNGTTASVPVSATAVAASGATVSQIRFYVDGVLTQTSDSAALSTTQVLPFGAHTLGVEALDNFNSVGPRHNITVNIGRPSVPVVTFINPAGGANIPADIGSAVLAVSGGAKASAGAGIAQLRLYIDGVHTQTSASDVLDTSITLATGVHSLKLEATDSFGSVGQATISVTVSTASSAAPIAVAITPPHLADPDAGTLPGALSVGNDGGATYAVELVVPPGTGGLQPQLSVNYSSHGSNGMVGLGWSLGGLSTIHRCGKTIAQDGAPGRIAFDTSDRLCLDGMRLLRSNGSGTDKDDEYWQQPLHATYRTEIEGFARITRLKAGGFRVEKKDGRINFYGADRTNAIPAQGRTDRQPLLWAITRTEDRSGNYMTYEYATDSTTGEYLPKQIRYGANSLVPQTADLAVRFSYESRPDAQIQYMGGSRNDLRNRLKSVKTYIGTAADGTGGTLARDFAVSYIQSATSGRSLVAGLQVCGEDGKCLPKTQMSYGSSPLTYVQKFAFQQLLNGDNENIPVKSVSGNFDGTGRTTIFHPGLGPPVCINCPSMVPRPFTGKLEGIRAEKDKIISLDATLTLPAGAHRFSEAIAGDLDGNGQDDLVLVDIGKRVWAFCLSTVSPDVQPRFAACRIGGTLPAPKSYAFNSGDLPGLVSLRNDGKAQLITFDSAGVFQACGLDNDIVSCKNPATVIPPGSPSFDIMPVNLSRQGMSDFFSRYRNSDNTAGLMTCNFYNEKLVCNSVPGLGAGGELPKPADINGDGLTDLFPCLSTEIGVDCTAPSSGGTWGTRLSFAGFADFIGDGIARYWSTPSGTGTGSLCQIVDNKPVCRSVDTSTIPQATLSMVINDADKTPFYIDESGIPASLNCSAISFVPAINRYAKDCWVGSAIAPANQDKLIGVANGIGQREQVDYVRGDDDGYKRYATVNGALQRPVYPQLTRSPGAMVRALRRDNGQGVWVTDLHYFEGALLDAQGRGSLGFTKMTVNAPLNMVTEKIFSQVFPSVGMELSVVKRSAECDLSSVKNSLITIPFSLPTAATTYFVGINNSSATENVNCSTKKNVDTTNLYSDNWGNLNKQTVTTVSNGLTFVSATATVFHTEEGLNYLSGLPTSIVTTKKNGAGMLTRTVNFDYETSGLIKSQTVEPTDSLLQITTTYGRDRNMFGLVNTEKQSWTNPACADSAWVALKKGICTPTVATVVKDVTYDAKGRFPTTVKNALGHASTHSVDAKSGVTTSTLDANNLSTSWTINSLGYVTVERSHNGNEKRSYLKSCGGSCPNGATVAQVTDHFNGTNRIAAPSVSYRDSAGHTVQSLTWGFDGRKVVLDQRYDELGRLFEQDWSRFAAETSFLAKRYGYDSLGRVIKTTTFDSDGTERNVTSTYQGLNVLQTNANGQQRTEFHNAIGELIKVEDANAPVRGKTLFEYDPFGNLSKTTDPNGNVITVQYDRLGRRVRLLDPDLGVIAYGVDPLGRTWWQESSKMRAAQQKAYMEFDLLGRMTGKYEPDLESHWVFDSAAQGVGQLVEAYTLAGVSKDYIRRHTYDAAGRPLETTQQLSDGTYRARTEYDRWGRPVTSTYQRGTGSKKVFSSRYNSAGYLARIERGSMVLWQTIAQDAAQRATKISLGNGLSQAKIFNAHTGRLETADVKAGAVARLQEAYLYDAMGNVTQRSLFWDQGGFTETLAYDELNRLKTSRIGGVEQNYTYDLAGNIQTKTGTGTFAYPVQGASSVRPHAVSSVSSLPGQFSYDENGNLLSGGGHTASWTSFDMPVRMGKGAVTADFVYGPEHQRTRQLRSDGSTVVYAGAQEVEVMAGVTTVKTYWPNGIGVEIDRGKSQTELTWTHVDNLGSPVALTNEAGAIREKLEYDPWGKRRSTDDNVSSPDSINGVVDNRGFTGHEMLDQLDLVHMNGRVYNPAIGRFISADLLITDPMDGQSYNRYSYVNNNPTNLTDPTGFLVERPATTIGGGGDWQILGDPADFSSGQPDFVKSKKPTETAANRKTPSGESPAGNVSSGSANNGRANPNWSGGGAAERNVEQHRAEVAGGNGKVYEPLQPLAIAVTGAALGGSGIAGLATTATGRFILASLGLVAEIQGMTEGVPRAGGSGSLAPKTAGQLGREGESAVRAVYNIGEKPAQSILMNGRARIPDGINPLARSLSEVKNVNSLSFTSQLRDYSGYAQGQGLRFDLYTRPSTQLSGPLKDAIDSGLINHRYIPLK